MEEQKKKKISRKDHWIAKVSKGNLKMSECVQEKGRMGGTEGGRKEERKNRRMEGQADGGKERREGGIKGRND